MEVLRHLTEPSSCTEVGARLDHAPQRVYYHVKRLVDTRHGGTEGDQFTPAVAVYPKKDERQS